MVSADGTVPEPMDIDRLELAIDCPEGERRHKGVMHAPCLRTQLAHWLLRPAAAHVHMGLWHVSASRGDTDDIARPRWWQACCRFRSGGITVSLVEVVVRSDMYSHLTCFMACSHRE